MIYVLYGICTVWYMYCMVYVLYGICTVWYMYCMIYVLFIHILCIILCVFVAGEQLERAFHLSLAALLGEGVYNFGELVSWYPCVTICWKSLPSVSLYVTKQRKCYSFCYSKYFFSTFSITNCSSQLSIWRSLSAKEVVIVIQYCPKAFLFFENNKYLSQCCHNL